MKKFIYLCGMMLLSLDIMAQIDLNDQNWDTLFIENFSGNNRSWGGDFIEYQSGIPNFQPVWRCYYDEWDSGVTLGHQLHHVFQRSQCLFQPQEGHLHIIGDYKGDTPLQCGTYELPFPSWHYYNCDTTHKWLYYYSGCIETLEKIKYGYFEIRCQLPIHQGAFPAFWLWDANDSNTNDKHYEEIDIFEFSWEYEDYSLLGYHSPNPHGAGNPYCFTSGLYYCDTAAYLGTETSQARLYPMINDSLSHWHTFSCEWMPDHILWYCDGNLIDEYHNPDSIPHHPLTLKANYSIDRYALINYNDNSLPEWKESDTFVIDYIKVYQLDWKCNTDEVIAQQSDLNSFEYGVKRSIAITSTIEPVCIGSTDKVTFRTSNYFEITGPFQVDNGGELTIIMQSCP